ncbi:MAG: Gfo/Idh/MocA family oxidoreductase [Spirochaetia bacterium]|nr:Gfo/Idh/MocA family oxidoreductase [Spirochaetia bacterium]
MSIEETGLQKYGERRDGIGKIRLGLVGCGFMGNHYAKVFPRNGAAVIQSCCDPSLKKGTSFSRQWGISRVYTDYNQMMGQEKLDAVLAAVPDFLHHPVAMAGLNAGYSVFCDKPMARTLSQAEEMRTAFLHTSLHTMVNFSKRNSAASRLLKEAVESGELGEIVHIDGKYLQGWLYSRNFGDWETERKWAWRLSKEHSTQGVLGDLGAHLIDLLLYVLPERTGSIRDISCRMRTVQKDSLLTGAYRFTLYDLESPDFAMVYGTLENSASFSLECSRIHTSETDTCYLHVYGTKGSVCLDLEKDRYGIKIYTSRGQCREVKTNKKHKSTYQRFIKNLMSEKKCSEGEKNRENGDAAAADSDTDIQAGRSVNTLDFSWGYEFQKILHACAVSDERKGEAVKFR